MSMQLEHNHEKCTGQAGSTFQLAMAQMLVEGGQVEANLQRAAGMIREAGTRGCKVVVLPECLDWGWMHPAAQRLAQPIPGAYSDILGQAAGEAGVFVAAGLTERSGNRLYNAAVLISPEGEILLKHRKINELPFARDFYGIGDRLSVVETPLGKIGITICADNFPDSLELARAQILMGCQLLLSPSSWAVEKDHDNRVEPYGGLWHQAYTTLARQNLTVIGVSNVGWLRGGPWSGRKCIGCSLAMGAGGEVLAQGPYGEAAETLIIVDIDLPARNGAAQSVGR